MTEEEARRLRDGIERLQSMTGSLSNEINSTLERFHRVHGNEPVPSAELFLWRLRLDTWHSALTNYAAVLLAVTPTEDKSAIENYMATIDRWINACKPDDEDISPK